MQYKRVRKIVNIEQLKKKTVTLVGLGSLGSFIALLLAKNGINLNLIDFDKVSIENLSSQLYSKKDLKKYKTKALKKIIKKTNSEINITIHTTKLTDLNLNILNSDLIIDCSDNLKTKLLIDSYKKTPWVHIAVLKTTGLIYVVKDSLKEIYQSKKAIDKCEDVGILNTTVFMASSIAVTQAIKILLNEKYERDIIRFNIWENKFEKIKWLKSS